MNPEHGFPKLRDTTALILREGPSDGVILEIAPTMASLRHRGERYFRMASTRHQAPDGSLIGCYLWSGWAPR